MSARIRCLAGLQRNGKFIWALCGKPEQDWTETLHGPRIGMDEGWQEIVFQADIAGLKTAAKRAEFQGRTYQQTSTLGLFEALFIVIIAAILIRETEPPRPKGKWRMPLK